MTGRTDWRAILAFYEKLLSLPPARGAWIGYALALAECAGVESGLAALDELEQGSLAEHRPYWAARADLLRRAQRLEETRHAYDRAIGSSEDGAIRRFLQTRQLTLR